jgi:Protein of unknown function (DUF1214)
VVSTSLPSGADALLDTCRMDTPAWAPASVPAAVRGGPQTASDLSSGNAWKELLERLLEAGEVIRSNTRGTQTAERVAGYRHLLVLVGLGIDECLRRSDPFEPRIRPGNVDNVLKWGMDCPDAAYLGTSVRGDASYVLRGTRGTVRYLGFQIMGGMTTQANLVADDLEIHPDGSFELYLSPQRRPGNWMPIAQGASSLVIRQFFYDWLAEEPARLTIECLDAPPSAGEHASRRVRASNSESAGDVESLGEPGAREFDAESAALACQLVALGEFVEASLRFWKQIDDSIRAGGVNGFRQPANRTDIGGAEENLSVWGSWEVGEDEALLIEVEPPDCLYWSVSLGNLWWESIDYAEHQSSLNGHQAVVDGDGIFRAVVSQRDPGVANWLDPAGHSRGPAIFRWLRPASEPPVPTTKLLKLSELDGTLPPWTARVDEAQRNNAIGVRRRGVARRFSR